MAWSERQRLMLQEMGLRLWAPAAEPVASGEPVSPVAPLPTAPRGPDARQAEPSPRAATTSEPRAQTRVGAEATAPVPAIDDRAAAIAAMAWPDLREAVAGCSACGLCQTRRQTVFGVGNPQAHWMIVGEAPGEQEDLKGEPFVGAAGHLLDSMLQALGLTRAEAPPDKQVYIANTLKCRPPRNRNPEPEEMLRCEPFLLRQIELIRPKLILAMGRFAVQALLRTQEPIGKLRGRVHRYQGVPLVVSYHPAYLLRNLPDKARAWDDLCLAAQVAERGGG